MDNESLFTYLDDELEKLNFENSILKPDQKESKKRKNATSNTEKEKKPPKSKKSDNDKDKKANDSKDSDVSTQQGKEKPVFKQTTTTCEMDKKANKAREIDTEPQKIKEVLAHKENESTCEKDKKSNKGKDNEELHQSKVLNYMKVQNRPYSAQNIFDNLHAEVPRAVLQRVLDQLSTEKKVLCKEYGKAKVYLYEQSQLGEPMSETELKQIEGKIEELNQKNEQMQTSFKSIRSELQDLEKFKDRKSKIIENVEKLEERRQYLISLKKSRGSKSSLDLTEIKSVRQQYNLNLKEWGVRKKICYNLLSAVSQMTEVKVSDMIEELGIDKDEDCLSNEDIV